MNQRMSAALIVVLLATAALRQASTPEFAATVGIYSALVMTESGARVLELTLREDLTAELSTVSGGANGSSVERGAWFLDGSSSLQLALATAEGDQMVTGVALERRDGYLVGPGVQGEGRFAGVTFLRIDTERPQPVSQREGV